MIKLKEPRAVTGPNRGPMPARVTAGDAKVDRYLPFTFSLEAGMVRALEDRMRREKHRNRSETVRVLLWEALK